MNVPVTSVRPVARPVRSGIGFDLGDINANDLLNQGFDLLEDRLSARDERRLRQLELGADRYRDETTRADLERDDDFDRLSLRERVALDRARINAAMRDQARDDQLARLRIDKDASAKRYDAVSARQDMRRDDLRTSKDMQRDDARALLGARADVYQNAFESRRGDTLVTRIMVPLAIAVAGIGAITLFRRSG